MNILLPCAIGGVAWTRIAHIGTIASMVIIVMGVSGVGKSTVGQALAAALHCPFIEGDDHHSPANIAKMTQGRPLNDADRLPWLEALNQAMRNALAETEHVVLACSALKHAYRDRLTRNLSSQVLWVHLAADFSTIATRMQGRKHFMPPSLLQSQFDTLEPPADALVIDATQPTEVIVDAILARLT